MEPEFMFDYKFSKFPLHQSAFILNRSCLEDCKKLWNIATRGAIIHELRRQREDINFFDFADLYHYSIITLKRKNKLR